MGRPLIPIDENQVEKLASIMCTMNEIAAFFGCSVDTIENRFSDVIKTGREKGTASLRRMQYQAAEKGNTAMLIWLGKQYLGQADKVDHSNEKETVVHLAFDPKAMNKSE
jgi:hypothetical protein